MNRCLFCSASNEDAAVVCQVCGRELPYREPRSPAWQRTVGWIMVWVGFSIAFADPELQGLAFFLNAAGWVFFIEDDWILRVTLGSVTAVAMCSLATALGERFSPLLVGSR